MESNSNCLYADGEKREKKNTTYIYTMRIQIINGDFIPCMMSAE